MDSEDKIEYAPKGMFPEDDDEDSYEIGGDLDVWDRGSGYTWGKTQHSWWSTGGASSLSGMWGGGIGSYGGYYDSGRSDALRLAKHKTHLDSLCKVVDPTVKHTLSFGSHRTGATNMETGQIIIDGQLLKSSDDNLDITCGLAIHEKLHLVHSKPLYQWQKRYFREHTMSYGEKDLFHSIENIIEDEYIERQLHKTCAGFVTYIEAVKKHYFEDKKTALQEQEDEFANVVNTLLMLVRYPSLLDKDRSKRHAPHIRYFASILKTGLDSRDDTYKCIQAIYIYMKNVFDKLNEGKSKDEKKEAMDRATKKLDDIKADFGKDGAELPKEMEKELAKSLFDEMMKRVKRESKYDKDAGLTESVKLSSSELADYNKLIDELGNRMLEEIEETLQTDYEEMTIDKNMRPNSKHSKVTWRRAIPKEDHKMIYNDDSFVMKKQTGKLKRKIDLYGETNKLTIRNQKRGRIDKRLLHRIPMGRMDLFKNTIIKTDNPLDVCILVDESGSMGHYTMREARRAAISMKEALADNPKLNLWVFGHTADRNGKGETEMTEYWSPTMKDRPLAMGGMRAKYENRDGTAIVASADRVKAQAPTANTNKLMVIFSDGDPSADRYRGKDAYDHTASCVKHVEARGWNVIQVGFAGAREQTMNHCFTNWIYVPETDRLADKVSKIIRKVIKV